MNDPMRQILTRKLERRRQLAALPVCEKLRMVEDMRDATQAIALTHPPKPTNPVRFLKKSVGDNFTGTDSHSALVIL